MRMKLCIKLLLILMIITRKVISDNKQCQEGSFQLCNDCYPCKNNTWSYSGAKQCNVCQAGYYDSGEVKLDCKKCPDRSSSEVGAQNINDCKCLDDKSQILSDVNRECNKQQCNNGYSGVNCNACSKDFYNKDYKGSLICVPCPDQSTSQGGIGDISQCKCNNPKFQPLSKNVTQCNVCNTGYSGQNCDTCSKDFYNQGDAGSIKCSHCPDQSSSQGGIGDISQCKCINPNSQILSKNNTQCNVCNTGYSGQNCDTCSKDFYNKGTAVSLNCVKCPDQSTSQGGIGDITSCKCNNPNVQPLSKNVTQCNVCNTGYSGQNCDTCSKNFYNQGVAGSIKCIHCPDQSSSQGGIGDISQCKCINPNVQPLSKNITQCNACNAGYSGQNCDTCSKDFYNKGTADSVNCLKCPDQSSSQGGIGDITSCKCNNPYVFTLSNVNQHCNYCKNGHTGTNCDSCQINYYNQGTVVSVNCVKCPDQSTSEGGIGDINQCKCINSISQPLSKNVTQCDVCKIGYSGQKCNECSKDYYNKGTASSLNCVKCPDQSTSKGGIGDITSCKCNNPYVFTLSNVNQRCDYCLNGHIGPNCETCFTNFYNQGTKDRVNCAWCPNDSKSEGGIGDITQCKCVNPNVQPLSKNVTQCDVCKIGYSGQKCNECSKDYYNKGTAVSVNCVKCPDQSTSQGGSGDISQCKCNNLNVYPLSDTIQQCNICKPGLTGKTCQNCQAGYFNKGGSSLNCQKCPLGSHSQEGSTKIEDCICNDNSALPITNQKQYCCPYGYAGEQCNICEAGFYQKLFLCDLKCFKCPNGYQSPQGSKSLLSCFRTC